jgi:hypothetical protein
MGLDIPIPLLIFLVIGALVVVGVAAAAYAEKRRREALQQVADTMGLSFLPGGDPNLLAALALLPLFSKGRSRQMTNLILGETDEVTMGVFDYRYTTGSGKNSQTRHQTVAYFRAPDLGLPIFEMKPQHFFHGIGKIFGYQDIDFDTHPRFSKAFLLRGQDEEAIRARFTADVLSALEGIPGVSLEGQGDQLVLYRESKRSKPDRLREFLQEGFRVFTLFRA